MSSLENSKNCQFEKFAKYAIKKFQKLSTSKTGWTKHVNISRQYVTHSKINEWSKILKKLFIKRSKKWEIFFKLKKPKNN